MLDHHQVQVLFADLLAANCGSQQDQSARSSEPVRCRTRQVSQTVLAPYALECRS